MKIEVIKCQYCGTNIAACIEKHIDQEWNDKRKHHIEYFGNEVIMTCGPVDFSKDLNECCNPNID